MQAAGVELVQGMGQLDLIGIIGPQVWRRVARRVLMLRRVVRQEAFDVVVLIDNPAMNLHLARIAKRAGHRVVYYITPQLWAWRPRRMRWMQRRVDHAIVILPFEEELYRRAGVPCTFVGHPVLDELAPSYNREQIRRAYGLRRDDRVLGLLPGSRRGEVRDLLPLMLDAAQLLQHDHGDLRILLALAETVNENEVKGLCERAGLDVRLVARDASGVMAASDLLFAASGTATLQAAILGTPMVIVYKVSWMTYLVGRVLVRVRSIGLPNLIAGRPFIPELIQSRATADRLADEARRILDDAAYRDEMRTEMARVRSLLGAPGASRRAAAVVIEELQRVEAGAR